MNDETERQNTSECGTEEKIEDSFDAVSEDTVEAAANKNDGATDFADEQEKSMPEDSEAYSVNYERESAPQNNAWAYNRQGNASQNNAWAYNQQGSAPQNNAWAYNRQGNAPQNKAWAYNQQSSASQNNAWAYNQQGSASQNNAWAYNQQGSAPQNNAWAYNQQGSVPQNNAWTYNQQGSAPQNSAWAYNQQGSAPQNNAWAYNQHTNAPQNNAGAYSPVNVNRNPYGYQNIPANENVRKQKSKTPAGLIAFLVSAALVFVICLILLAAVIIMNQTGESNGDGFNYENPTSGGFSLIPDETEPETVLSDDDVKDTTNDSGARIELEKQPGDLYTNERYTAKYAYDNAKDTVVGVIAYNDKECESIGSQGTGIIISDDGYIITNSHVIGDSRQRYKVMVMIGGEEFDAQVTGYDTRTDLAVLKIEKEGLIPAKFADSSQVSVGQNVVALGNPGGMKFSNSLTQGIVSALDRDVSHGSVSYIQTDAAINPGNSGGPLLNMSGQVIGMTTIKLVNTSYEGMGFAIPSKLIVSVADSIIKDGRVEGRVKIGITGMEINQYYSQSYGLPAGIYVSSVDRNGPSADSGIAEGDIITKIDGVDITTFTVLYSELDKHSAGDKVTLTYERAADENGEKFDVYTAVITLEEYDD